MSHGMTQPFLAHRLHLATVDSGDRGAGLSDHILGVRESHHLDLRGWGEEEDDKRSTRGHLNRLTRSV